MIQMTKKGSPNIKNIVKATIGIRETDAYGDCVYVQLDEFELLLTTDRAESFSAQLVAKVRKIKDRKEQAEIDKRRLEEEAKLQKELPLPQP